MKRLYQFLLSMLLVVFVLAGCGVPQEDYDKTVNDLAAAQTEIARLETELAAAQEKNRDLQSDLDTAVSEYQNLLSESQNLQSNFDALYSATTDLTDTISFAYLYESIAIGLTLPTITGDALSEAGTINGIKSLVEETGDAGLQEKFDAWAASPRNKNLAAEVIMYAALKVEDLVFYYEFPE